jgi:proteasome lid subunit RPN8/RPN11
VSQRQAEAIELADGIAARLVAHARAAAPRECCGFLVGSGSRVEEFVPTANVDPDPSRYRIDPASHIELNRRLRGSARSILGVYHSHPRGGDAPSPSDVAEASYRDFVHVIVSLEDAEKPTIRAYRIAEGIAISIALMAGPEGGCP